MTTRPWHVELPGGLRARSFATRERAFHAAEEATGPGGGSIAAWVTDTADPLAARITFTAGRLHQIFYRTPSGWDEQPSLGDIRWWSALRGTGWTLIDVESVGERRAGKRVHEVIAAGGTVRPATRSEVAAWADLQRTAAALRDASSIEERWAALGVDPGHEQIALL